MYAIAYVGKGSLFWQKCYDFTAHVMPQSRKKWLKCLVMAGIY